MAGPNLDNVRTIRIKTSGTLVRVVPVEINWKVIEITVQQ